MESLQLAESLPLEDSHTHFLAVLKNLGSFYMQFKKYDLSAPLYEKAHEVATKVNTVCFKSGAQNALKCCCTCLNHL